MSAPSSSVFASERSACSQAPFASIVTPDAAVAHMASSAKADKTAEAIRIIGSTATTATIAMDAIIGEKRSPIVAMDATDPTDMAIATISQMADATRAAEAADFATEATIGAQTQRKRVANNAPSNAAMEKAAPIPDAIEWG